MYVLPVFQRERLSWALPLFFWRSQNVTLQDVIQAAAGLLQALRGDVRVPIHHGAGQPPSEHLQFVRGRPRLPVPRGERVPQVMPAEINFRTCGFDAKQLSMTTLSALGLRPAFNMSATAGAPCAMGPLLAAMSALSDASSVLVR